MKIFKSSSEKKLAKTLDINVGDGEKIDQVWSADMDYMMTDDINVGDAEKLYHASSSETDYMILDDNSDGESEIIGDTWPAHENYMMLDDMTLSDMILDDMKMDEMILDDMKMDEMIKKKSNNPLRAAIGLDIKPCPTAKDQKATKLGLKSFGPQSAKNRKFADPKVRPCKPPIRKAAICREVRQPTTAIPKGPATTVKKAARVVQPPPVIPKKTTGISKAALNYNASERIKNLAKPRSLPNMETIDKKPRVTIKPQALAYKPSLRIQQLALPRNRIEAKNSSTLQANTE